MSEPASINQLMKRRRVLHGALAGAGGLAAAGLGGSRAARAEPADPDHGPVVTPDPIASHITASGLQVKIVDVVAPPRMSAEMPYAVLNTLNHAGDGSLFVYANDTRGKLWRINRQTGAVKL